MQQEPCRRLIAYSKRGAKGPPCCPLRISRYNHSHCWTPYPQARHLCRRLRHCIRPNSRCGSLAVTGLVGASDFPVISTAASAATVAATATALLFRNRSRYCCHSHIRCCFRSHSCYCRSHIRCCFPQPQPQLQPHPHPQRFPHLPKLKQHIYLISFFYLVVPYIIWDRETKCASLV